MTRITLPILGLALAGVALSCSGTRSEDDDVAARSVDAPAAVGRAPIDDEDDADVDDEEGDEEEVVVALADVPRIVLEAAQAALPGVVLTEAEMEQEDGQTVYSLSGTLDGEDIEIEISATGQVLEIERE